MAVKEFEGFRDLRLYLGRKIGVSNWLLITQEMVNAFASVTGDNQWIHVDVERARRESQYGGTIAHGYLTIALTPRFFREIFIVKNYKMKIVYRLNNIKFPAPLLVGSRIRLHVELLSYRDLDDSAETVMHLTIECEGNEKPICIAEIVNKWFNS